MPDSWPEEAHGIDIPLDRHGNPRLFTGVSDGDPILGVVVRRRMTEEEVQNWIDSKTGRTDVAPLNITGRVP